MAECEPGTSRTLSDGTREICLGGFWVPIAEPIRQPLEPHIAVINTPAELRAVAQDPHLMELLKDTDTHLVISVERTERDEPGGAAAAGDVASE